MKRTLFLVLFLTALLGISGLWAATITVGPSGYDHTTISAAITAANPAGGDVIEVYSGTYNEDLYINKGLTLQAMANDVTINCQGSSNGVQITGTGLGTVTIDGFIIQNWYPSGIVQYLNSAAGTTVHVLNNTLTPRETTMTLGIQICGDNSTVIGNTVNGVTNGSLSSSGIQIANANNVTVQDNVVSGADQAIVVMDNLTTVTSVSNITVQDNIITNQYIGIMLNGLTSDYTSMDDILITGNTITGGRRGINAQWLDLVDITITGNDISGTNDTGAGIRLYSSTCTISGTLDISSNNFTNNLLYQVGVPAGMESALAAIFANNTFDLAAYLNSSNAIYSSIQTAIDDASAGDVIQVAAGTYQEQLHITTNNITIQGAGQASTKILSPDVLTLFFGNNKPVVWIDGVQTCTIQDLTVDGNGAGNNNYRFQGIAFWNAGGALDNVDVTGIMETPLSGAQHGVGVYAYNDISGTYSISCSNMVIDDYQKNAMALSGDGLTVDLDNITTIGAGQTTTIAQNGIQVGFGATGTVEDCTVSDNIYIGDWSSTGIMAIYSPDLEIINCDVIDNSPGVEFGDSGGFMSGGSVSNTDPEAWDGIYIRNYGRGSEDQSSGRTPLAPSPSYEDYTPTSTRTSFNVEFSNVEIIGCDKADSWGLYARNEVDQLTVDATGCEISNWAIGVYTRENGGTVVSDFENCSIHDNLDYGFYSNTALDQDATYNWWGDEEGPFEVRYGDNVSQQVLYDPWWADEALTTLRSDLYVVNLDLSTTHATIQDAIANAVSGNHIYVPAGEWVETGQIVIDKDLSIIGEDKLTTIIKPAQSTGSSGDARGWFLVEAGNEFNLSNLTLDGEGYSIHQGIRSFGTGTIDNNIIKNIYYSQYTGLGMVMQSDMTFSNNTLSNIERIGMMVYGTGVSGVISGNTYIGKGDGDWLDYGIEIGGGAYAEITGNEIYNIGVSDSGWESSAIMLTDLYGPGTAAEITGNSLHDNYFAIIAGYAGGTHEDESLIDPFSGNDFYDNGVHFRDSTVLDYALGDIVANNTYDSYLVMDNYILGNGTGLYVDVPDEVIPDAYTQTYSVVATYVEDLRGFTVQVEIPKADFENEPTGFALAAPFDSPIMINEYHDATNWIFEVSGAMLGGVAGQSGADIVLFEFDATSTANYSNVSIPGCEINIVYDSVILKDDQNPYNVIPCPVTFDGWVLIDNEDPEVVIDNNDDYLPVPYLIPYGGSGLEAPVFDLTYTDDWDLATALYLIQGEAVTAPDDPTDFSDVVGTVDGTLTDIDGWTLPITGLADGTYTIYLLVTDEAGNFYILDWDFIIDTVAPTALEWVLCRTTPDADVSVDLEWSYETATAPDYIHVWALDYADISTLTTNPYPEYDPMDLIVDGTITNDIDPYTEGPSTLGWIKVAEIPVATALTLDITEWPGMDRGYYYFTIYAVAENGQVSPAPETPFYRESISYWPGDVSAIDGSVNSTDIGRLSAVWGLEDGDTEWDNEIDVGPSTDFARRSRPMPDDVIDIEDLMMFAMNYDNTDYGYYDRNFPETEPVTITLGYESMGDLLNVTLELDGNTGFLKGLDIPIAHGSGLQLQNVEIGPVWPDGSLLLHTDSEGVVTVSCATLGQDAIVEGNGLIATLTFASTGSNTGLELREMIARTHDNSEIEIVNNPTGNVDNEDVVDVIPESSYLGSSYPNPFRGSTTIEYGVKEAGSVRLSVYNNRGQLIRSLVNESKSAGTYQLSWDGRDDHGNPVSSGIYLFRMETRDSVNTQKAILLK